MSLKSHFLSSLLVCAMVASPNVCLADPPAALPPSPELQPGEPDVGAAVSPMKRGQIAPFTGVLLSPKALATVVADLNSMTDQIKIEVDRARGEEKARCDFSVSQVRTELETDKKIMQAHVDDDQAQLRILEDHLKKAEQSQSNALIWGFVGLGSGIAVSLLTVAVVSAVTKRTSP